MNLSGENIKIATLLGSKAMDALPRFAAVENALGKHVLPFRAEQSDVELWLADKAKDENAQFFPFSFRSSKDKDWYLLPWEPLISIDASVRKSERYIAKAGKNLIGSIKERWSVDDYSITITGAFYGQKIRGQMAETYPRRDMERLRDYLLTPEALEVKCEPLQILNINKISIDTVSFPFSKGEYVQAYEIKAKSDFPWNMVWERQEQTAKAEVMKSKAKISVGELVGNTIKDGI